MREERAPPCPRELAEEALSWVPAFLHGQQRTAPSDLFLSGDVHPSILGFPFPLPYSKVSYVCVLLSGGVCYPFKD